MPLDPPFEGDDFRPWRQAGSSPLTPAPFDPLASFLSLTPAARLGAMAWHPPVFPGHWPLAGDPPPAWPFTPPSFLNQPGQFSSLGTMPSTFPIDATGGFQPNPDFPPGLFSGSPSGTDSFFSEQLRQRSLWGKLADLFPPNDANGFPILGSSGRLPASLGWSPAATIAPTSPAVEDSWLNSLKLPVPDSSPFSRLPNALNPTSSAYATDDDGGGPPSALVAGNPATFPWPSAPADFLNPPGPSPSPGSMPPTFPPIDPTGGVLPATPTAQSTPNFQSVPLSAPPFETDPFFSSQQFRRTSLWGKLADLFPPTAASGAPILEPSGILPASLGWPPAATITPASLAPEDSWLNSPKPTTQDSNPLSRFLNALNPISSAYAAEDEGGGFPPALAQAVIQGLLDAATAKRLAEQQKILNEARDARQDLLDIAQGKASSRALGRVLEASGVQRPTGYEAHHIAAGDADDADPARQVLKKFGININDAANGVFLPAETDTVKLGNEAVHGTLHTKAYYQAVNAVLKDARTRQEAIGLLQAIGRALQSGDFP
jgi:hypothetical protein